ncbi:MAG TPA: STAS domain-containing protein [Planctomycetota bacterium]|nr:STAS domain-containing protein [Planctomycetota bacterium]
MDRMKVEDRGSERWIHFSGELDQADVLHLKGHFDAAVKAARGDVVVDLGAVTFIGTLGIGLIVSTREQLEDRGLTLKLSNVPEFIEKTFKVMSLTEVFARV